MGFSDFSKQYIQIFFSFFSSGIKLQNVARYKSYDLSGQNFQSSRSLYFWIVQMYVKQIHKPQLSFSSVLMRIVLQLLKIVFLSDIDIDIDFRSLTLFCGKQSEQNMRLVSERNFSILFSVQKSPIHCFQMVLLVCERFTNKTLLTSFLAFNKYFFTTFRKLLSISVSLFG